MGTFFDVRAFEDLELSQEDFSNYFGDGVIRPNVGTMLEEWQEFGSAAGVTVKFSKNQGEVIINSTLTDGKPSNNFDNLYDSIIVVFKYIDNVFEYYLNNNFNEDPISIPDEDRKLSVPIINIEKLREFGAANFGQVELIGTFIVELKKELPDLISRFDFATRQTFEKGVVDYVEYKEAIANARFHDAQRKADAAEIIEAEALKTTEKAHQSTDAALGAEATAEGLKRLTTHWRDKAQHHQKRRASNFMLFAGVLVVALIALFLSQTGMLKSTFYYWCGDTPYCPTPLHRFLADLSLDAKASSSWVVAILSLKGVVIPILGVAWLLRILSRQNQFHFALENDARQRLALLVSFVRLQELPEVKLTDDERLMILTELFRPTDQPTHPDGPPNVGELIAKFKP